MGEEASEAMRVGVMLAALSIEKECEALVTALKALRNEDLAWDKVTARIIDESRAKKGHKKLAEEKRLMNASTGGRPTGRPNAPNERPNRAPICCMRKGPHECPECPCGHGHSGHPRGDQARQIVETGKSKTDANPSKVEKPKLRWISLGALDHTAPNDFFLDSGCSQHMMLNKDWFVSQETIPVINIKLAKKDEHAKCNMKGMVDLNMHSKSGERTWVRLTNVLYVPDLDTNLL